MSWSRSHFRMEFHWVLEGRGQADASASDTSLISLECMRTSLFTEILPKQPRNLSSSLLTSIRAGFCGQLIDPHRSEGFLFEGKGNFLTKRLQEDPPAFVHINMGKDYDIQNTTQSIFHICCTNSSQTCKGSRICMRPGDLTCHP